MKMRPSIGSWAASKMEGAKVRKWRRVGGRKCGKRACFEIQSG